MLVAEGLMVPDPEPEADPDVLAVELASGDMLTDDDMDGVSETDAVPEAVDVSRPVLAGVVVGEPVETAVPVAVLLLDPPRVCETVPVGVEEGVTEDVRVLVGVTVGVRESLDSAVCVGVIDGDGVCVGVTDKAGDTVGVFVEVDDTVGVREGVEVPVLVRDDTGDVEGTAEDDAVELGEAVEVAVVAAGVAVIESAGLAVKGVGAGDGCTVAVGDTANVTACGRRSTDRIRQPNGKMKPGLSLLEYAVPSGALN